MFNLRSDGIDATAVYRNEGDRLRPYQPLPQSGVFSGLFLPFLLPSSFLPSFLSLSFFVSFVPSIISLYDTLSQAEE
jgi:hypothetical protein